ncbi:histidine kinase [Runella rosea]|uniref:Histidine kinase n=1 Tax=Runella rosea TaxID=2259595 RepID=A0A344TEA5_9BACT|nr:histidine kinase [Runella rosea]AXE16976.1 histidine kinase [Runella rosea]
MSAPTLTLPAPPGKIRWRQLLVVFTHIFFWACFIFLPFILIQSQQPAADTPSKLTNEEKERIWQMTFYFSQFFSVLIFYANSEVLLPKVFKKHGLGIYLLIILTTFIVVLTITYFFRYWMMGFAPRTWFTYSTFYSLISVIGVSTCFQLLSDYQREHRLQNEQEKVRLQSELSFLRSQISPHFMFNLMNSLAALARKKSDLLEPMIVKMSDLLRYMLYDSDDARIPLDKEMNYLKSYVELQQMRFGNKVKVEMDFATPTNGLALEPMLLIPFVENAFKHGTGFIREPYIQIALATNKHKLHFRVQNRFNSDFVESKDGSSGIGLANVRRRLELLYPEQHTLKISKEKDIFITEVEITLK